ncbi:MAG: TlpA disulfide reductase family protein [Planctomycetota bacterium]
MSSSRFRLAFLLISLGIVGCGKSANDSKEEAKPITIAPSPSEPSKADDSGPPVSVVPPPPAAAQASGGESKEASTSAQSADLAQSAELATLTVEEYKKEIEGYKGKTVVVDAWATWCVPCRAKFPHFVELANKHGKEDVVFISLNFDMEEEVEAAKTFLADSKANMRNLRIAEELAAAQETLQFEGLPRYFLYDPEGKLLVNSSSLADVENKLSEAGK